jgi:predicted GNAT family acetyltransferase
MIPSSSYTVSHNLRASRFEVDLPGEPAVLVYMLKPELLVLLHTEVPPEYEGMGIAALMTRAALEFARDSGLKVRSFCSYTTRYIERHKEYQDLLD